MYLTQTKPPTDCDSGLSNSFGFDSRNEFAVVAIYSLNTASAFIEDPD